MMRMLFWKEIHENIKWALLALLLMFGYTMNFGTCLCGQLFAFVSILGGIFGGALGMLQTVSESNGDRRALLLHRPVPRTQIFLAKVLAGSSLYLLAMGLPVVVYLVTTFLPGYVAPQLPLSIRWKLIYPWFADILTGLVYYQAGLFAGLHHGRWYGSRILGIPVAFLVSHLAWNSAEFSHVLIAISLFVTLLSLAAWGRFLTSDDTDRQPWAAKLGFTAITFIGLSVVVIEAKSMIEYRLLRTESDTFYAYHEFTKDGRIYVIATTRGSGTTQVTDLDGNLSPEHQKKNTGEIQREMAHLRAPACLAHAVAWNTSGRNYRDMNQYIVGLNNPTRPYKESWCYVTDLGRVVGYDSANKKLIGSIGPDGFAAPNELVTARFQRHLDYSPIRGYPDFLVFPDGVYDINFEQRRIQQIFSPTEGEVVYGAKIWDDSSQPGQWSRTKENIPGVWSQDHSGDAEHKGIVIGTSRAIYLQNERHEVVHKFPMADNSNAVTATLRRFDQPDRFGINFLPSYFLGLAIRNSTPAVAVEYDTNDQEIARQTLPLLPYKNDLKNNYWLGLATSPAEYFLWYELLIKDLFKTASDPQFERTSQSLFALNEFHRVIPHERDLAEGWSNHRVQAFAALIGIQSLLSAIGCFWLSRRLGFSAGSTCLAVVVGLVFGLVGFLTMAVTHDWPACVSCSSCQRKRLVTQDHCWHCQSDFSGPLKDGTEVFA